MYIRDQTKELSYNGTHVMHIKGPIHLPILVHLSSHPSKGNTYHTFINIRLECIVVDTTEYRNIVLLDTMNLYNIISMYNMLVCVHWST